MTSTTRRRRFLLLFATAITATLGAAALSLAGSNFTDPATQPLAVAIHSQMTEQNQQFPHGVPTFYSWYTGPFVTNAADANGYGFGNPWGEIYASRNNSPLGAHGETLWVDIKDLNAWTLSKTSNTWMPLYTNADGSPRVAKLGGALYPEDFQGSSISGNLKQNADGSETVAPKPAEEAPVTSKGYLFHFYPSEARATIANPADVAAVCSTATVRLDPNNPATGATYSPGLIANMGFDWWSAASGGSVNGAGDSQFLVVKRDWRTLVFCTAPDGSPLPPIAYDAGYFF